MSDRIPPQQTAPQIRVPQIGATDNVTARAGHNNLEAGDQIKARNVLRKRSGPVMHRKVPCACQLCERSRSSRTRDRLETWVADKWPLYHDERPLVMLSSDLCNHVYFAVYVANTPRGA